MIGLSSALKCRADNYWSMTMFGVARMCFVVGSIAFGTLFSQVGYCDYLGFLEIADADRLCKSGGDCVLISYSCSHCDCGTPVNSRRVDKYHKQFEKMCAGYRDGSCMMRCDDQRARCVEGRCVLIKAAKASSHRSR